MVLGVVGVGGLGIAAALLLDVFLGDLGINGAFLGDLGAFLEELLSLLLSRPEWLSGVRERSFGDGGHRLSGSFPSFPLDLLRLDGYGFAGLPAASLVLE